MLEDYIQETILDQNKLAAGSDRYDKMRCCWLLYAIGNKNNFKKLHFNNLKTGFLWKNVLHLLHR